MDQLSMDLPSPSPAAPYTASDLIRFTECRHAAALELDLAAAPAPPREDPQAALVAAKGAAHEQAYLAALERSGIDVARLDRPRGTPMAARLAETRAALAAGRPVIYQATLAAGRWLGIADFLRRADSPSALGGYSYEVVDTKLARHDRPKFLLQLCLYSELLARLQGRLPLRMHVVLGDGVEKAYRLADFRHYYRGVRDDFEQFLGSRGSYPLPCELCELCRWQPACALQWERDDHLCRVAGIRRDQMLKLQRAGVDTLAALARLDGGRRIARLGDETLRSLHRQAAMQLEGHECGEPRFARLPLEPGSPRGFNRLPRPDEGDLFFDMEGDPFYADGLEYLFGVCWRERGKQRFRSWWAHDRDAERQAFEAFVDFAADRLEHRPDAHIYHYANYEESALKRLASYHGTGEAQIDDWLRRDKLVDLYKIVRQAVVVSEPGYSIKHLERFYRDARAGEVTDAGASIVYYERWRESAEPQLLAEIERYNRDDCLSLAGLRDWLLEQRPDEAQWWNDPDAAEAPAGDNEARARADAEREAVKARLAADCAQLGAAGTLLAELIDFHRREQKPEWWAFFDRQEKDEQALIDDAECLAALELESAEPDDDLRQYRYRFPPQESKLRPGTRCVDTATGRSIGLLVDVDERRGRARLRLGRGVSPPQRLSLGPPRPYDDRILREAVARFARSLLEGTATYPALERLLRREPPKLRGRAPGNALAGDASLEAIIAATLALDHSHLFIQGPPGAGKTHTGSRLICALLERGLRVGVSAHSHKAIHHLLDALEREAAARGLAFAGLKKAGSANADSVYEGRCIRSRSRNVELIEARPDLLAGTAWLFADEGLGGELDYLLVEEAGQVSLANVVAMGMAARNLIFLGDQMQLAQPIKGTHPGRSGESVLEFLLDGEAVIPADRGIFLETTWRMHPRLCDFISQAVYDGRLMPEPQTARQQLLLAPGADSDLREAGLVFVELAHEGNSQSSPEEVERVAALYDSLLKQRCRDRDGTERTVRADDILVVSPYNVQVNRLQRALPPGARVGTVDRFQGQEAHVVIVSMASSSSETLPRNVEFLYSRNRLNVAISRARSLAVLIASPALLSIACRTVEQMQLVNTLCWARSYARAGNGTNG